MKKTRYSNSQVFHLQKILEGDLLDQVNQLYERMQQVVSFAGEHDFKPGTRINGYWSFVTFCENILEIMSQEMTLLLDHNNNVISTKKSEFDRKTKMYLVTCRTLIKMMNNHIRCHHEGDSLYGDGGKGIFDLLLDFTPDDFSPFYSDLLFVHLPPFQKLLCSLFYFFGASAKHQLQFLIWPFSFPSLVRRNIHRGTAQFFRNGMDAIDMAPVRMAKYVQFFFEPSGCSLLLPRISANTFGRDGDNRITLMSHPETGMTYQKPVRAYYLNYNRGGEGQCLNFNLHGGGYVALKPETLEPSLRMMARRTGIPVLSIDYRLIPEVNFTDSLDDILNAYLFVTSGRKEVEDMLGFQPKKVIITGDSAGGHISLSLSVALNELRRKGEDILMPHAIHLQYPITNPTFLPLPSRGFAYFDGFLVVSPLLTTGLCLAGVGNISDPSVFSNKEIAWEKYEKFIHPMGQDKYLAISSYENLKDLKDVKLTVHVCEFDPLVDDGCILAKIWPGTTILDCARGMTHGITTMIQFDQPRREVKLMCDRMRLMMGFGPHQKPTRKFSIKPSPKQITQNEIPV